MRWSHESTGLPSVSGVALRACACDAGDTACRDRPRGAVATWLTALLGLLLPLAAASQGVLPTDRYLWLVPDADNTQQQGFIRLLNRGGFVSGVTIWGIDADGVRSTGTVSVGLSPHQALQMNSQDLEQGNDAKGLIGSLGAPSVSGNWTLVLRADRNLDALAYIRTPNGFLTSMHERVSGDGSDWWVPVFNPGSNPNQRSRLRIVNTEVDAVDLSITGTDDAGESGGIVSLSLSGLSSIELDATDLENGNTDLGLSGALGDGEGKWQLRVHATGRISVQSLLSDPNGNLTNLSSLPNPVQTAPGERNVWLLPAAANVRQQGFLRLINRESRSGEVLLWGIDDAGQRSTDNITLTLAPDESRQLNSNDLESGNVGKGLTGSLGTGTGDWHLKVLSDLDLVPMAFIRTPGGFLTAMHDSVAGDGLLVQVPIFNPGENRNQVSSLRLINDNATAARIRIGGRDDAGAPAPGGEVTLTLAAGAAITLSAQELEGLDARAELSGSLGDGSGKWALTVTSTVPVRVMSLLNDPQGFLANLSGGPDGGASSGDGDDTDPLNPQLPAEDPVFRVSASSPFVPGCDGVPAVGVAYLHAEVEPYMAANPADLRNLVGAWQQDRWSNGGAQGIVAAASFDGGMTWTQQAMPFSRCGGGNAGNGGNFARASDPWVSVSPDGTVHLMALVFNGQTFQPGSSSAMVASRSSDGGLSWGPTIALINDGANFFNDKNTITADPTDSRFVYAVWDRLTTTNSGPTYFARSSNGGVSWEAARSIYDPGVDSQTIGNVIAVLPDGTLIALFTQLDGISGTGITASLRVIRSLDKGATWSAPITVAQMFSVGTRDPYTSASVRDGAILGQIAAGADGTLAVVWQDARFGDFTHDDIALSVSSDGGLSWSAPAQVNPALDVPAFTPTVSVGADGTLAVSYYDLRNNTDDGFGELPADHWLARSRSGAAWSETHVSGPFDMVNAPNAGGFFLGDYQALVATGELLIPFFVTANNGNLRNFPPNPTDVFVAPARSLLGTLAPLTAPPGAPPVASARTPAASAVPDETLRQRVADNVVRVMEARIAGWSRIMRAPTALPPPQ